MSLDLFDRPVCAQRKYFIQEITGLDEVFDFLDEWPPEKRNLAYDAMHRLCMEAATGKHSLNVVRWNFERFLKQSGKLAELEDVPPFLRQARVRNADRRQEPSPLGPVVIGTLPPDGRA